LLDYSHLENLPAPRILEWAQREFGAAFAIATSFQKEGMALIDMAARLKAPVRVLTLDTGRLPEETLDMIETVRERYGIGVEVVRPEANEVQAMVARQGIDLFYESVESRRLCSEVRKVRPLERKLREFQAWAAGLRREQSPERAAVPVGELVDGRLKLNPLAAWTAADVERYTHQNAVPVHPLYARGYASIGCEPCTRAICAGESERAGRWWWEVGAHKECGIHIADGAVRRA